MISAMQSEKPIMQGVLLFPPQGMLVQLKKTWHKRFCQLFKASKYGIERVEFYDSKEEAIPQQHSPRIITLEACVKISPSNQPHVFTVVTKTGVHHFGCLSESEMTSWIDAFRSVAFKENVCYQSIEEDNDLYCTSGDGVFAVKLVDSDASKRCGLEAKNYTLIIAATDIKLMDGDKPLYTWPYRGIRRYGYRDGKFTFEAGRKCESGEGSFHLEHNYEQDIFRCISIKMKSMKKLLSGENSPSIECNDAQYHAAMSMEAGSRSPLPPSPNTSSNSIDVDFSTISQNSQKYLNLSSSSLDSISFIKPPPPIIKPKPAKPPRKHIFTGLLEKKTYDPEFSETSTCGRYRKLNSNGSPELSPKETVSTAREEDEKNSYDMVEVRSDAWKTHGVNSVTHTERVNPKTSYFDDDDCQYETMESFQMFSQGSSKSKASKTSTVEHVLSPTSPIIHNHVSGKSDQPNYDKLQHFGSTHKLNHNVGYKTPNNHNGNLSNLPSPPSVPIVECQPSWNEYSEPANICSVRLADDSHLGYGIIRKKSIPPSLPSSIPPSLPSSIPPSLPSSIPPSLPSSIPPNPTGPKHNVYNESEYAVVSKPKKV